MLPLPLTSPPAAAFDADALSIASTDMDIRATEGMPILTPFLERPRTGQRPTGAVACPTPAPSATVCPRVVGREGMPALAVRSTCALPAPTIGEQSYRLKVVRVHARAIAAEVIERHAGRDRPTQPFVNESMRDPRAVDPAVHASVAVGLDASWPEPAPGDACVLSDDSIDYALLRHSRNMLSNNVLIN
jgi:hypothetical protein